MWNVAGLSHFWHFIELLIKLISKIAIGLHYINTDSASVSAIHTPNFATQIRRNILSDKGILSVTGLLSRQVQKRARLTPRTLIGQYEPL
jgi:hypothetical protein